MAPSEPIAAWVAHSFRRSIFSVESSYGLNFLFSLNFGAKQQTAKMEALQTHTPVLIFNTLTFRYKHMARNTSVTLGDHFEAFITSKIEQGRFQSVSEAVRAGLRKLEEDEARLDELRTRLQAGENSPRTENFDSGEFLKKLHKKHLG